MSDHHESLKEAMPKRAQRATTTWKIGEKYAISHIPSVEGMVVATRWMEEVFMVVFLAPPFQKEGGVWAEAALTYKNAAVLVREPLTTYDFPFPKDKRILQEVTRANGNVEMLCEIVKYINKIQPPPPTALVQSREEPSLNPWGTEEVEAIPPQQSSEDRLSVHLLLSQQGEADLENHAHLPQAVMEKIMNEVSQRFSLLQPPSASNSKELVMTQQLVSSTPEMAKSKKKHKKKKKKKHSSASSSSSSSSSSDSSETSSSDSEVGSSAKEKGKGWVKCPFSQLDSRMMVAPREKMKSMKSERIMLRTALKNIYNQFTTLQWFVETIHPEAASFSSRPYQSDVIWLRLHATYLDSLLLQPLAGPWSSWNEIIVDYLTRAFLELIVRASPERKYPDIIEEKVRKWMKKRRVGVTSSFGSIPAFLADATINVAGIQPKGGWEIFKKKDNRPASANSFSARPKNSPPAAGVGEKKL